MTLAYELFIPGVYDPLKDDEVTPYISLHFRDCTPAPMPLLVLGPSQISMVSIIGFVCAYKDFSLTIVLAGADSFRFPIPRVSFLLVRSLTCEVGCSIVLLCCN